MNSFISTMSRNNSSTANGMATNSSSNNPVLDMFFLIGAARTMSDNDIISLFSAAYNSNKLQALKILFYARDIEKGLGERRVFRTIIGWLIQKDPLFSVTLCNIENLTKNIIRVDDLVWLANTMVSNNNGQNNIVNTIVDFLFSALENKAISGIVAKWMPRKNSKYHTLVKYMRQTGRISSFSSYRKYIVSLTNVVEQQMSAKKWDEINLEHTPSIAMKKYKKAFNRHNILKQYIDKVVAGEAKINAKRLFPYDITNEIVNKHVIETNRTLLNEQWKNLAKLDDLPTEFRAIPIIDVSGSMWGTPIAMSTGLGIFMAEHNPNEAFRDYFITFSSSPAFQKIYGHDIVEKVRNVLKANWNMSTNLEAVFNLILDKAKVNSVPANEMPTHVVIISDMEFNQCSQNPSHNATEMIKHMYMSAGYEVPTIVFWNVNGRPGNVPAQLTDNNVLLVSGASQNVINFILKKGYEDLMSLVFEVINSPRYDHIK